MGDSVFAFCVVVLEDWDSGGLGLVWKGKDSKLECWRPRFVA